MRQAEEMLVLTLSRPSVTYTNWFWRRDQSGGGGSAGFVRAWHGVRFTTVDVDEASWLIWETFVGDARGSDCRMRSRNARLRKIDALTPEAVSRCAVYRRELKYRSFIISIRPPTSSRLLSACRRRCLYDSSQRIRVLRHVCWQIFMLYQPYIN